MPTFPPLAPNGTWTDAQTLDALIMVIYPGSWVCMFYSALALVLFYIFKSNHKFPVVVLGWISLVNVVYSAYMVAKWTPGTDSTQKLLYSPGGGGYCFLQIFADHSYAIGVVCLNTVVSVILYLGIVRRIDVDYNYDKRYYRAAIIFFWLYMLTVACAIAGAGGKYFNGLCHNTNDTTLLVIPYAVLFVIQIVLIFLTIARVMTIANNASGINVSNKGERRVRVLAMRFGITLFSEALGTSAYLSNAVSQTKLPPYAFIYAVIAILTQIMLDSTVLLFLNRPLLKWLSKRTRFLPSFTSSERTQPSNEIVLPTPPNKFSLELAERSM